MIDVFLKLDKLTTLAKQDKTLRQLLIDTESGHDPLLEFCNIAKRYGVDISIGELVTSGEEYCDKQCKSTNGGNPSPYDSFNDTYENFIASLK